MLIALPTSLVTDGVEFVRKNVGKEKATLTETTAGKGPKATVRARWLGRYQHPVGRGLGVSPDHTIKWCTLRLGGGATRFPLDAAGHHLRATIRWLLFRGTGAREQHTE